MAVDWGKIAQVGMGLASQYANNRSQARAQAAQAQQTQNSQGIAQNSQQNNVMLQMAQIELLRKQMEESSRQGRAQQTALGDLMANVQDASFSRPSHITNMSLSGGLRPSALGPNTRDAGAALSNQSLQALLKGDMFMPLSPAGPIDLDANMPKESSFDKILGLAGTVGNAYQGYQQQQKQEQQQSFLNDLLKQMQQAQQERSFNDALRNYQGSGFGG